MRIGNMLRRFFRPPEEQESEERRPLDISKDGDTLYKEDIIANILEDLEKRREERNPLEQQWRLNANFLAGNQYCEFNRYRGEIEQVPPVKDWMEREVYNMIAPLIETRVANLKKINYRMKVKPRTNETDDYAKADVSTTILQYIQNKSDFDSKKNTAIYWNELCGNCFWLSWWDNNSGEKYAVEKKVLKNDDGVEVIEEKAYFQGDLDYGLLTPYEVFPESIYKEHISDQRSIIIEQVRSADDIFDMYGVKVDGTNIETFSLTPVTGGSGYGYESTVFALGNRSVENAEKVITYFERPSKYHPNGIMAIIVGREHLVYYGALPYEHIPIVQMKCIGVAGQFFGKSVIEDLIPRQRAYNGCMNRIHEYIKRLALQSYMVQGGSIDIDEFQDDAAAPGSIITYQKGFERPYPVQNGNLPSEVLSERQYLKNEMEYVAGVSQLMVSGNAPSGVTSGTAIDNLMEIDNTRLSLTGEHIREAVRQLAVVWLEINKKYATVKRVVSTVGSNSIGNALVWSRDDINSFDVEYTTENELLMSEDTQKQNFLQAFQMGLFTDETGRIPERIKNEAIEYMKCGNYTALMNINTLHLQKAKRENAMFAEGVIPKVSEFDNHDIHLDEHMRYLLQMEFEVLKHRKPEYAKAFEDHIRIHQQLAAQENQNIISGGGINA